MLKPYWGRIALRSIKAGAIAGAVVTAVVGALTAAGTHAYLAAEAEKNRVRWTDKNRWE